MIRRLLSAMAVVVAVLAPGRQAAAHTDACAFQGAMTTSAVPNLGTTVQWQMTITIGTCVNTFSFSAVGDMTGSPLLTTTGTGITNTGHRFAFTGAGGALELAGEVAGTFVMTPDITAAGGTRLIVNAVIALVH